MKNYINTGSKDTRSGFGAGMTELGQNENVVALCADLIGSLKFDDFKKITQSVFSKSELQKQT
jgi:transketolase